MAIIFTICELIYYFFIAYIIQIYNNNLLTLSSILLFIFSLIIALPSIFLIYFIKNRKHFFIISSILIIVLSTVIYLFRNFSNSGILNFTFYVYSIIFMLIPFFSMFTLGIHKLFYNKKRKQLYLLIVFKKIIIIFIASILIKYLNFNKLLVLISIIDCIYNLCLPFISNFLLKYQD